MSKLYTLLSLDEMVLHLVAIQNPNLIKDVDFSFFERQMKHIQYYYFAPSRNGKTVQVYSNYASASIKLIKKDNQIELNYCNPKVDYDIIGCDCNNASKKEFIAYFICTSCLNSFKKRINTQPRLIYWLLQKDYAFRLASCFMAKRKLLKKDIKRRIIDELYMQAIYIEFQILDGFWKIINNKWNEIKTHFKTHSDRKIRTAKLNEPLDLFLEILKTHIDNQYRPFIDRELIYRKKENRKKSLAIKELTDIDALSYSNMDRQSFQKVQEKEIELKSKSKYRNYWLNELKIFLYSKLHDDIAIQNHILNTDNLINTQSDIFLNPKFKKQPDFNLFDGHYPVFNDKVYSRDCVRTARGAIRKRRGNNKS